MLGLLELTCPTVCTCLFKLRPGVLSKTLSHMWGKLNLPMFLFNVGWLTIMNMDSLIFLAKLCLSLLIIWKLIWLVGWLVWLLCWWMGERSFRCSLYLSPKFLEISPMYSSSQERSPHWNQYMAPLLLTTGSLSLVKTSRFLIVLLPLKWVCMSYLPQIFSLARNIKESIFIRVNNPTLNRNIGKFNLLHIWDRVLLNTPGLNLKRHVHTVGHVNSNNPNTPL